MFTRCRIGSMIGAPLMLPSSLAKAITEPVKVTAPMATPSDISTKVGAVQDARRGRCRRRRGA